MSVSIPRIDQMFLHLDRWRHLPAYQLERRIDIFFSVYLVDVLREITGDDLVDTIIPELPLKRDLVVPGNSSHHSVKVDYAVFTRSRDKVYFVELKTDDQSRRTEQDDYLNRAQALGFRPIVDGIRQILLHTDAHQKYFHLTHSLAALGYLDLPDDLATFHYPMVRRGLTERLEAIETTGPESAIEVVYVQPNANRDDETEHLTIDFSQFADHVDKYEDEVSRLFASHLRRWRQPAGGAAPWAATRSRP